jgi:hypothetical protein
MVCRASRSQTSVNRTTSSAIHASTNDSINLNHQFDERQRQIPAFSNDIILSLL